LGVLRSYLGKGFLPERLEKSKKEIRKKVNGMIYRGAAFKSYKGREVTEDKGEAA